MSETGPKAAVKGVTDEVKGRAKQAFGAVTGNERMEREGDAQQKKADAERETAQKEAEAEKARLKAAAYEQEQRAHQRR